MKWKKKTWDYGLHSSPVIEGEQIQSDGYPQRALQGSPERRVEYKRTALRTSLPEIELVHVDWSSAEALRQPEHQQQCNSREYDVSMFGPQRAILLC